MKYDTLFWYEYYTNGEKGREMQSNISEHNNITILKSGVSRLSEEELPGSGMIFGCVLGGEMEISSQGARSLLGKGKLFVRTLSQRISVMGSGKAAYVVADGELVTMLCSIYNLYDVTVGAANEAYEELFGLCETANSGKTDQRAIAFSLHKIIKAVSDATQTITTENLGTGELIKEYIDSHAGARLTLEELASVFFLSKTQIFRIFKSNYGQSPMQYFLQQKIEISKGMLLSDGMRISDIAETLGFSDAKHFSKTFKKYCGILPRDYRREIRAKGSISN